VTRSFRRSLCALVLALGALVAGAQAASDHGEADGWLARFNRERQARGVRPLLASPVLDQVAQAQAEAMAGERGGLREVSAAEVSARLRRVGYSAHDWRESYVLAGEVDGLASVAREARCRALLDSHFRDLGVGVAATGSGILYVFLFGWHQGAYFADVTAGLDDRARVEAEMLARINDVRRRQGLTSLAASPLLDRVSQEHAEDMLLRSYFGHQSPEGLGPSERARADGYRSGIGENIVEQRFSTAEALAAWLNSPGHRRNILDPDSREMGLGLAIGAGYDAAPGGYRVVWVQSFGRGE
jgi:uncharacterized protein YkwD